MEDIFDKIEAIFSVEEDTPKWANEILEELKEIKKDLKSQQTKINNIDKNYYEFIKYLRKRLRADVQNDYYPTLIYNNKRYGINFDGLIYDKQDLKVIRDRFVFCVNDF